MKSYSEKEFRFKERKLSNTRRGLAIQHFPVELKRLFGIKKSSSLFTFKSDPVYFLSLL